MTVRASEDSIHLQVFGPNEPIGVETASMNALLRATTHGRDGVLAVKLMR